VQGEVNEVCDLGRDSTAFVRGSGSDSSTKRDRGYGSGNRSKKGGHCYCITSLE